MDSVSVDFPVTQDLNKPSNAVEKTAELAKKYWTSPHDLMVHLTRRGKFESPETERSPVKTRSAIFPRPWYWRGRTRNLLPCKTVEINGYRCDDSDRCAHR